MRPTNLCPPRARPRQRGVGLLGEQLFEPLFAFLGEQRAPSAATSPRLQRAALLKLLAHAAHRGHAKTEHLCNFASALALLVEVQNSPAHRNRDGRHSPYTATVTPLCKATSFMEML